MEEIINYLFIVILFIVILFIIFISIYYMKINIINIFFTKEQINKIYELYTENMPNFTPVKGVECYFKNANPDKIIFKNAVL